MKYQKRGIKRISNCQLVSDFTSAYKRPVYQVTQGKLIFDGRKAGKCLVIFLEELVENHLSLMLTKVILIIENKVYYLPLSELESLEGCYGQFLETQDSRLFFIIPSITIRHLKTVDPYRECSY